MSMFLRTRVAERIARQAHEGQVDKAGRPYIEHPERVAASFCSSDVRLRVVAWLHDVVEDSDWTVPQIEAVFGEEIADDVDRITRREWHFGNQMEGREPLDLYYERVKGSPLSLAVKRADIADNADPKRLLLLPEKTRRRLAVKYEHALHVLGPGEN